MRASHAVLAVAAVAVAGAVAWTGSAVADADPKAELVIDGKKLITRLKAPKESPFDEILSGWRFRSATTRKLQEDDFDNPAFIYVENGQALWTKVEGTAKKACSSCHGKVEKGMKGVRAQMPKWNAKLKKPQALQQHVNACRTKRMGAKAWKWESNNMLSMTALISLQSRGMPMNVKADGPMKAWMEKGKKLYYTRVGQLAMACSNCHEDNYGKMIRADHLSQGQINGFPVYRLKWQGLGSIHRRFKGCMKNIRAKPYKVGGDEFIALEAYVASRGKGLSVEGPSVRN